MWHVSLDQEFCPHGIGKVSEDPSTGASRHKTSSYCYVSADRRTTHHTLANLEDPFVIRFVNATDEEDRVEFLRRFGLLSGTTTLLLIDGAQIVSVKAAAVKSDQKNLLKLLHLLRDADLQERVIAINAAIAKEIVPLQPYIQLSGKTAHLVLQTTSLYAFMLMEILMAATAGAAFAMCGHCCDAFLTGPLTRRRSTAVYCSDRCRVAGMRARQAKEK